MREARAPILVVTGPSGVGKSTVSRLVAATVGEKSTHIRMDDFIRFVVNGWVEPWLPESLHQNRVLGGAVLMAAMSFAEGGYTVLLDGHMFPDALAEVAPACRHRGVPLHYVVLRADLGTCWERATSRSIGERPDDRRRSPICTRGSTTSASTRGTWSRPLGRQTMLRPLCLQPSMQELSLRA